MDYQGTFSSESGQRVLRDLCRDHHVMTTTFYVPGDGRPGDPLLLAFREGQRDVVCQILELLRDTKAVDPHAEILDLTEGD